MKFSEIPRFTRDGSWECDYSLDKFVRQINMWVEEEGLDLNPDFQRGHIWDEQQQIAYLEFLLRGGKTARVIYLNNPNWQTKESDSYTDFVCVDGLQRATSIIRFVNNEIKVFGHYYDEYEDTPRINQGVKVNINQLPTRKEVLQCYLEFNSGGTVHTEEELNRVRELLEKEQ
jgi:hypothetical protein